MITKDFYEKLEEFICKMDNKSDEIKILNFVMKELGYIPSEVQEFIADKSGLFLITIKNAIDFFPKYKDNIEEVIEIKVCAGMSCKSNGSMILLEKAKEILGIEVEETTEDGKYKLLTQRCFGQCKNCPNVSIGGTLFKNVKAENLKKMFGIKDR
jgi:NADH:ubiquinone oxidoreductase subunit E